MGVTGVFLPAMLLPKVAVLDQVTRSQLEHFHTKLGRRKHVEELASCSIAQYHCNITVLSLGRRS